ncbi:hypothetical protein DFA_11338 [Cavenderia fasciculata]|uniref:Uncharacterized protein n=1 Tax=Cavenderia fasciculata TaxID=261658 RepID=F4QCE2_CACFS|nr:uncharacterized protein DFA_11338 [Cavenderia fasciculata]EGG13577.1 hypothetical protein DFA_11338 [Cavenderia fasciculata]|eukprot:XP_004350281.1 hypothetical protein DFA_11338 [Cavenderia fasciculata]
MSTHTLTTIIPMSADDFYAITETHEFDQFCIPYLGLNSHELKEENEDESNIYRRVCIKPKTSVPKFLLKFANNQSEVSYEDTQVKSKIKREISFKTNPPLLPENINVEGVINIEPLDDNSCLKVHKVTFKFTGALQWFSSMIENNILSELKKTMELLPKIIADYKKYLIEKGIPIKTFTYQKGVSILSVAPQPAQIEAVAIESVISAQPNGQQQQQAVVE